MPWEWRCRGADGALLAQSQGSFRTLRDAVADASANGFQSAALEDSPAPKRGGGRSKALR